ncbi:hypothetical protein AVEN_249193-1 [Araneus ventricosus]|uniref:Tc1-like transposase DDE domain-containing protein n=1 Tax=Araneus ventricosus TaxID=182803 RepID=A0A4Y2PCX9_ARAVE|nr:hypothetical protein AVEN_99534-1 [Araneus ventricosus]GBN48330.1 hypothetical protein AVEN_249193-1 [Araneus ventricosus]
MASANECRYAHAQNGSRSTAAAEFQNEITSCPLSQFSTTVFTSLSEENHVPDKCSSYFGKRNRSLSHREAIRRKRPGMLCDGVILLHDNTHTARKTQELPRKFKWEVWSHQPPYSPDSAPNLGSKHLSATRFSSNSDAKTAAENWLNGQDVISSEPG